jgi:uncharacterized protein YndB with AHSA1/START domain
MFEITQTFTVDRPADAVFAYLTDPDKLASWQPTTVDVRRQATGPFRTGEVFEETHKAGPRKLDSTFRVDAYEPPREFSLVALEGPVKFDGRWQLAEAQGATTVTFTGAGSAPRLLAPLMKRSLDSRFRSYHRTLKGLIEKT